jgi:hypothetical protein
MNDDDRDDIGTAGWGLLATAWIFAFGYFIAFFFNFSPNTNFHWIWNALPIFQWAFPAAAFASAAVLHRSETTIWKKVLGWTAFGVSLVLSWGLLRNFNGI